MSAWVGALLPSSCTMLRRMAAQRSQFLHHVLPRVMQPSARGMAAVSARASNGVVRGVQVPEPAPEDILLAGPLCEMHAEHRASLSAVMAMYSALQAQLREVGDSLAANDGPSADELRVRMGFQS